MRNPYLNRPVTFSCLLFIFGVCAPGSPAQTDPTRPPAILVSAKGVSEAERERELRGIQRVPQVTDKQTQKLQASLMKQLGDDFRNLQIVDNEMMSEVVASKDLNCEHLTRQVGQIKTRASNLKIYLALPDVPATDGKKDQSDNTSDRVIRAHLDTLDKSIRDFVTNPIFRAPKVLDANLSVEASRNLRSILELSDVIKRHAGKLVRLRRSQK